MKCINCYREISATLKFCPACGTKQPVDRAAYEREHPELADAMSEDEISSMISLQQTQQAALAQERQRLEEDMKLQEEMMRQEPMMPSAAQPQPAAVSFQAAPQEIGTPPPIIPQPAPAQDVIATPPPLSAAPMAPMATTPPPIVMAGAAQPAGALLKCPDCGNPVPANAPQCGRCGAPMHYILQRNR